MTKTDGNRGEEIRAAPGGGEAGAPPPPSELETGRLLLRPISAEDVPDLYSMFNDPLVRRYLWDDRPVSFETTISVLEASLRDFSERSVGLFGLRLRDAEELAGVCGLRWEEGLGEMEIMYCLLPEFWGRGLATEAANACLRFAFDEVGLERVLAGADRPNAASLRVIRRLGMRPSRKTLPGAPEVPYYEIGLDDFLRPGAGGCPG